MDKNTARTKGASPRPTLVTNNSDITLEKTLPNNLEAERAILGSILLDDSAMSQAAALREADFYLDHHRRVFGRMRTMAATSQRIESDHLERRTTAQR